MAYKLVNPGDEALAADVNGLYMSQTVARFSTAAARTAAIAAPAVNQLSMLDNNPGNVDYWNGTAWMTAGSGGELQYTQITAGLAVNTYNAAGSNLVIAGPAQTYDGTAVVIEFFAPAALTPNVAGGVLNIDLWDASSAVCQLGQLSSSSPNLGAPLFLRRRITPTAGSHTWRVAAWVGPSGAGQIA